MATKEKITTIATEASPEAKESLLIKNKESADTLSQSLGFEDSEAFLAQTGANLKSEDFNVRTIAEGTATAWFSKLLMLCLYQKIQSVGQFEVLSFANLFDDGTIENGNSKEYIFNKPTGKTEWLANMFVPDKKSKKSVESHVIQMYDADGNLGPKAYQFKKTQTIESFEYLPYFLSGTLNEFIYDLTQQIEDVYAYFKFEKLASLATSLAPAKTVAGTATNMFDCLVNEVFPLIKEMTLPNVDFNYNALSKAIGVSQIDDLLIIMSTANAQKISSGIKTQLYNAQLFGSLGWEDRIVNLGKHFVIGTQEDDIAMGNEFVDDNTIYVIDRKAIKHLLQINKKESQSWAENMTISVALHVWGAADILPWGKCFKYTNVNLSKLPE